MIVQPLASECWEYRHVPAHLALPNRVELATWPQGASYGDDSEWEAGK